MRLTNPGGVKTNPGAGRRSKPRKAWDKAVQLTARFLSPREAYATKPPSRDDIHHQKALHKRLAKKRRDDIVNRRRIEIALRHADERKAKRLAKKR